MCKNVGCEAQPQKNSCFCKNCWNNMFASFNWGSPPRWNDPKRTGPDARANRVGPRAGKANQRLPPLRKQPSCYSFANLLK